MHLTIDKFGRVLIPKPLRDRLGLVPGTELALDVREGPAPDREPVIELRPEPTGQGLAHEDGILVHRGRLPEGFDAEAFGRAQRDERARLLTGRS